MKGTVDGGVHNLGRLVLAPLLRDSVLEEEQECKGTGNMSFNL